MRDYSKKLSAEAIGTFVLVLLGAGAVIVESHTGMSHLGKPEGKVGLIGIALAHGLTLTAMLFGLGSISGGHFNPAVSFAFWLRQKLSGSLLVGYALAQTAGALVAAMCLAGIFPDEVTLAALGTPQLAPKISALKGVLIEGTITFVLVLAILLATREDNEDRRFAPLAVGGTLAALIVFAGPLTGAGANPARFLGPAAISGNLTEAFVYLIGPIIGGGVAALLTSVLFDMSQDEGEADSPSAPASDEAPAPAASERGKNPKTVQSALRRAHQLFVAGNGEEAASVLLPHLAHVQEYGADVVDRIRSLIIVIEEEHGRIRRLDKYREALYSPGLQRSPGLSES